MEDNSMEITQKLLWVSESNFQQVQSKLNGMIDEYRMNAENWVIARFRSIGTDPTPTSLAALNEWIELFLPDELAAEISNSLESSQSYQDVDKAE
jgi:hypothetical protein